MTDEREQDGLRQRFGELRAEAERPGRVPEFGALMARARAEAEGQPRLGVIAGGSRARVSAAPGSRRLVRVGAWATAAVAATVATLVFTDRQPDPDAAFEQLVAAYSADLSGGAWESPTSSLLEVPGMDLTRSMPSIGSPVRGLDPSSLPPRESVLEERS